MKVKGVIYEDFINFKKPCMYIAFPHCKGFKCGKELCQNSSLVHAPDLEVDYKDLVEKYLQNPISEAICIAGLEPFDDFEDLKSLIQYIRSRAYDQIIIYTGYNEEEIAEELNELRDFGNIIIKFGRFVPNQESHFDEVLGVKLASPNQYGKELK